MPSSIINIEHATTGSLTVPLTAEETEQVPLLAGQPDTQRHVFSIAGLAPEVLAVAMAKYSRSPLSIKETIAELTEEKSAAFHEKWVLGYGDASVADMAVVGIACENLSILASKAVQDCRLASYQEKSTRYQVFDTSRFYRPPNLVRDCGDLFEGVVGDLVAGYHELWQGVRELYLRRYPPPSNLAPRLYHARVDARALDVARYLLPTCTLTNFGFVASARELRRMIAKLLASDLPEAQQVGDEIRRAAIEEAYNPRAAEAGELLDQLEVRDRARRETTARLRALVSPQVSGAPTLVKHTDPSPYEDRRDLAQALLQEIGAAAPPLSGDAAGVDFVEAPRDPLDELVASLLYPHSRAPFRTLLAAVEALPRQRKADFLGALERRRGRFDAVGREFEVPGGLLFDTLMDYGAFRDLQRHRMCTQLHQPLAADQGYATPPEVAEVGFAARYAALMERAAQAHAAIAARHPSEAAYVLPLAFRKRTLFKMDLRELTHVVELRTRPGGHAAYRSIAYAMYEQFRARHPELAAHIRAVTQDPTRDFFRR